MEKDLDVLHLAECSVQGWCVECFWAQRKASLEDVHTLGPGLPTWIETTRSPFGVGCQACRAWPGQRPSAWTSCSVNSRGMLRHTKFNQHAKTLSHKKAVAAALKGIGGQRMSFSYQFKVPSKKDFRQVLLHVRKQPLGRDSKSNVGSYKHAADDVVPGRGASIEHDEGVDTKSIDNSATGWPQRHAGS